jgi:hypothetical protein
MQRWIGYAASAIAPIGLLSVSNAPASPIFSQAPAVIDYGYLSDKGESVQSADDFVLTSADTVRSVTWRGFILPSALPTSFELTIYGDLNTGFDLPDENNVISVTTVAEPQVTLVDTGLYEFRADLTPAALTSGTTYWFSAYADTGPDIEDPFFWATGKPASAGSGELAAQKDLTFEFHPATIGPLYFVLDNAVVPEPSSAFLSLIACVGLIFRARQPKLIAGAHV